MPKRRCKKCSKEKSLSEFYKDNSRGKPQYTCKMCHRQLALPRAKFFKTPEGRKCLIKYSNKARLLYPEKWHARYLTRRAVAKGLLVKKPCLVCGIKKVQAHHEDYYRPMDVMWFCSKHHSEYHLSIKPPVQE